MGYIYSLLHASTAGQAGRRVEPWIRAINTPHCTNHCTRGSCGPNEKAWPGKTNRAVRVKQGKTFDNRFLWRQIPEGGNPGNIPSCHVSVQKAQLIAMKNRAVHQPLCVCVCVLEWNWSCWPTWSERNNLDPINGSSFCLDFKCENPSVVIGHTDCWPEDKKWN